MAQTKLTASTCKDREFPLCPYCGCKNLQMLGFMRLKREMGTSRATCNCCRQLFEFETKVEVTFTSAPIGGWKNG